MTGCCDTGSGFPDAGTAKALARNNKVIWGEICAIQQAILDTVSGCTDIDGACVDTGGGYCVIVGGKTPMTWISDVTNVNVIDGGHDYFPVIATASFSGPGTGATGDVVVSHSGIILNIAMTNGGTGYDNTTVVTIDHPTGTGFEGVVQLSGSIITGVSIQDGGILYSDLMPLVAISDVTGNGGGAQAHTVVDVGGIITEVVVTEGGANYSSTTIGEILPAETSSGADAEITVDVSENPYNTEPYRYYLSLIGQLDNYTFKDQIENVLAYFTNLSYSIEAQINPDTNATIQWEICWC